MVFVAVMLQGISGNENHPSEINELCCNEMQHEISRSAWQKRLFFILKQLAGDAVHSEPVSAYFFKGAGLDKVT